jgi:hypothetical protein
MLSAFVHRDIGVAPRYGVMCRRDRARPWVLWNYFVSSAGAMLTAASLRRAGLDARA